MPEVSRASAIAAWCLSNAVCLITAPMKFEKFVTSPTLIERIVSSSGSRIRSHTDFAT